MSIPESAAEFLAGHVERVRRRQPKKRIVFSEGGDPRVLAAAERLAREGVLEPILIGARPASAPASLQFIDPASSPQTAKYASLYVEKRRGRITQTEAMQQVRQPLWFAALMVAAGDADGAVGGATNTTAETVRAALQAIGVAPGVQTVSGFFVIAVPDRKWGEKGVLLMADCAVVVDPTAAQLADITLATAESARTLLGVEPIVAMLSFSTKGSARHCEVAKVVKAFEMVRARAPQLEVDGELQADAALVAAVGSAKSPNSRVPGRANTLIFPNLNSGNIGYKLAEWTSGGAAFGPLLQGLAKPANDLSRACTPDEVYTVAVITAMQAGAQ